MKSRIVGLQKQYDLLIEKIECLRKAHAIENDPVTRLKYEKQIEQSEKECSVIEKDINILKRKFRWKIYLTLLLSILSLSGFLAYEFFYYPRNSVQIIGNVKEIGQNTFPVSQAEIVLSQYKKIPIRTDENGNFEIKLPTRNQINNIELQITYNGNTFYRHIEQIQNQKIYIEIPPSIKNDRELDPFSERTFGILVASFEGGNAELIAEGRLRQHEIVSILNARFRELKIPEVDAEAKSIPLSLPKFIDSHREAREIGEKYNAKIVIWGDITNQAMIPNLTIVHPSYELMAIVESELSLLVPLTDIQDIRLSLLTNDPTALVSFVIGLKYFKEEQDQKALFYFDNALNISSSSIDRAFILSYKGSIYMLKRNYQEAIALFNKTLELNPQLEKVYYFRGLVHALEKNYKNAIDDFSHAISLSPTWSIPYITRGLTYRIQGDYDLALSDLEQAITLEPTNAMAYTERGAVYFYKDALEKAIQDHTKAIELSKVGFDVSSTAYYNRANSYFRKKEFDLALEDFQQVIQRQPNDKVCLYCTYIYCAQIYRAQKNFDEAIAYYQRAINLQPEEIQAYKDRGFVYQYELENMESAIVDYTKVLSLDINDIESHIARGFAYYTQGDINQAVNDFTYANKRGTKDELDRYYTINATVFTLKGQIEQVIEAHTQLLTNFPEDRVRNSIDYYGRGKAYSQKKDFQNALNDLSNAIQINPFYTEAYLERGNVYSELNDYKKAIADYDEALANSLRHTEEMQRYKHSINPQGSRKETYEKFKMFGERYFHAIRDMILKPSQHIIISQEASIIYSKRGIAYARLDRYEQALSDFEKSIELDADSLQVYIEKAKVYEKIGRINEAVELYNYLIRQISPPRNVLISETDRKFVEDRIKELKN